LAASIETAGGKENYSCCSSSAGRQ